ncbi:MAG: hypothetical protein Q9190_007545, partial [Brigantiaea leucoxantha]
MAAVAQQFMGRAAPASTDYTIPSSDADAEGEEDAEGEYEAGLAQPNEAPTQASENDQSNEDAQTQSEAEEDEEDEEDEEEEDEEEEEEAEKRKRLKRKKDIESDDEEAVVEDDEVEVSASSGDEEDESEKSESDAESGAGAEWEGASDGGEDASVEVANRNNCMLVFFKIIVSVQRLKADLKNYRFCGQDEEHDPSEDYEEYMACSVCGDNSHRQCARDANSLGPNEDPNKWRCPSCVNNHLEPDHGETDELTSLRRRTSTSKLARDLLPAHRGTSKVGSHSVFNELILADDPLDGTRSLRKRKISTSEQEIPTTNPRKRRRTLETSGSSSGVSKSPAAIEKPRTSASHVVDRGDTAAVGENALPRRSLPVRPSRARRPTLGARHASIVTKTTHRIILKIQVSPPKLVALLESRQPKKWKRPPRRPPLGPEPELARPVSSYQTHQTPFYSFHSSENDELKSKPYGGILSETEANTEKTLPLAADRSRFNEARRKAEEEWKLKTASEGETETNRRAQKVSGPPSKIKCVNFGGYEIETWYAAPYPEEYSRNRVLYICEFCLKYMNSDYVAWRHKLKCPAKHPPGDEIYRDSSISVFEVDGRKNPVYCQNLCLLAKLFLGSKTLYYDVEPFLFYVMTEYDELGCHFVGYFSKEKRPSSQNNVSCILTLPTHQRKGYGNLLISFSYLLTRVEGKTGSPEKPLSDMGLVSYRNYWRLVLAYELLNAKEPLSIVDLSDRTGMTADDIVAALEALRALVRDPITKTYALRLDHAYFKQCIDTWEAKDYVTLNPKALVWTPYIMGHSNLAYYDRAPPLPTIAPREGEDEEENGQAVAPEEGVQQATAMANSTTTINGDAKVSINDSSGNDDSRISPIHQVNGNGNGNGIDAFPPAETASSSSLPAPPATPSNPPLSTTVNGNAFTPSPPSTSIPPTRYEIFPPIPGTTARSNNRRARWRDTAAGGKRSNANTPASISAGKPSASSARRGKEKIGTP